MPRRAIASWCRGVDADDHVAHACGDRRRCVLDMDLEARSSGARRIREPGSDTEVLGEAHRRHVMTHPVDVAQFEPGVVERRAHHRRLELAAAPIELAGGRHLVGHADERSSAPKCAVSA